MCESDWSFTLVMGSLMLAFVVGVGMLAWVTARAMRKED